MIRIDARGLKCPWPVIRLARAVREGADEVTILADDPIAPSEIAALAAVNGWSVEQSGDAHHVKVNARQVGA